MTEFPIREVRLPRNASDEGATLWVDSEEQSGSKEKLWCVDRKTGDKCLLKLARPHTGSQGLDQGCLTSESCFQDPFFGSRIAFQPESQTASGGSVKGSFASGGRARYLTRCLRRSSW